MTNKATSVEQPSLLVVDDDPDVRALLCDLFSREGYRVHVANDGASAISFLEHHTPPQAILLDLLMPGILGTSVLSYLGTHPALVSIPVAIVSSSPQLVPFGYASFKKPLKFAPLLEFVRNACNSNVSA